MRIKAISITYFCKHGNSSFIQRSIFSIRKGIHEPTLCGLGDKKSKKNLTLTLCSSNHDSSFPFTPVFRNKLTHLPMDELMHKRDSEISLKKIIATFYLFLTSYLLGRALSSTPQTPRAQAPMNFYLINVSMSLGLEIK